MKITRRQLRQIIKEAIDVTNASTGEVMVFADEGDQGADGFKPDAPELAARDIIKRLGLRPLTDIDFGDREPGVEEIYLGAEDWAEMDYEVGGKRHKRKAKKERARMDIDNLIGRLDQWSSDSGPEYAADNPDADMEGVARDLAMGARYSFATDEWDELIWHFDNSEDALMSYIADSLVSVHDVDGDGVLTISEMKITRRQLRQIIKEEFVIERHVPHDVPADQLHATKTAMQAPIPGRQLAVTNEHAKGMIMKLHSLGWDIVKSDTVG